MNEAPMPLSPAPGARGAKLCGIWSIVASITCMGILPIPALLSQPAQGQDKAAMEHVDGKLGDLVGQYDKQRELGTPLEQIPSTLGTYLQQSGAMDKNPWNLMRPAFRYNIEVVTGTDREGVKKKAKSQATELGEAVFVLELPLAGQPGFLAGAVRTQAPVAGELVYAKVTELED